MINSKFYKSRYLVGIRKKDSEELTLMEVDHIFNMKQSFKQDETINEEEKTHLFSNIRPIEQKQILVEELGNKRSRKILKTLKNNIVKVTI